MCDQQSLRSACAYAQSDRSLCLSLEYSMIVKLLTEHHIGFLSLKGGCTGASESTLVQMPHCWKSHVTAQLLYFHSQKQLLITFCICIDACMYVCRCAIRLFSANCLIGVHYYHHYVSLSIYSSVRLHVHPLAVSKIAHNLNHMVYFGQSLHTYACQCCVTTGMRMSLF